MSFSPQRKRKIEELTTQVEEYEKKLASTSKMIQQANKGREETVGLKQFQ